MVRVGRLRCNGDSEKQHNEIEVIETQMAPIKSGYTIFWRDSNNARLSIKNNLS